MNRFMKSFLIPVIVFFGVGFVGYKGIMYEVSRIQHDPINTGYITIAQRDSELNCLAQNVYAESGVADAEGKIAVAQVTLNRVKSGKFASGVCNVIFQKSQFSWTNDKPKAFFRVNKKVYEESKVAAQKVLMEGYTLPSLKNATYYYADYISKPSWANKMTEVAHIGHHIFYAAN